MKTQNRKTRLPRRLIGFVAAFALALSLLPVGVLTAFGEGEAILQALNLAGEPEAVLAEEAPTSVIDGEDEDIASTDETADPVTEPETPAEDAAGDTDDGEDVAKDDGKQEAAPSQELKAFTSTYEEAVAAAAAKDKDALAKALETATGLHAMLSADELEQPEVARMWTEIEGLRATLSELAAEVTDPAAIVNGTGYETLQEAIGAANAGDTVIIAKDLALTEGITVAKAITLDLGGKKLTASGCSAVTVTGASATVRGGTIEVSAGSDTYAVTVGASGSLSTESVTVIGHGASGVLVNGGSYVKRLTNIQATDGFGIRVVNGGSASHEGGMVVANYGVFVAGSGSTFNMNGGDISAAGFGITGNGLAANGGTTINISGGSVSSTDSIAVYHPQAGTLTVSGGSLSGTYGGIGIKSGTLTVTGGTIAGTSGGAYVDGESNGNGINVSGSAIHVDSRAGYAGGMNISISGGTLSSNNGYAIDEVSGGGSSQISSLFVTGGSFRAALGSIRLAPGANASVSGGSFSHEVPAEYCATGFVCDGENGSYDIVRADSIVEAQIGDTTYKTLAEAIAAAKDGDTVVLLRSVSADGEGIVVSGKAITLDLNGKTITGSGITGAAVVSAAGGSAVTVLGNGGTVTGSDSPALATTGGSLVVSGGSYRGNTTGCINAQQGAITVYGGTFGCEYAEGPGVWYVLAGDAASFKIYGGTFLNAEPAESQLASGCKVISDGAGKFDVTRNYSGNITLLDGTPVEGNTIVFADETTLQMIEVTDPNFGDKSWEWRAGFKITVPEGSHNPSYSQISDWFNDDGSSSQWVSAGSVADDGIYYVSSSQAMMEQYKGGDNQLMYRYGFDWDGDGVNDQYVTVIVKDTVTYADHADHVWDEGIITVEPTCANPGTRVFTCAVGGETRTEEIPALGCDWDEWVYYDATCTTGGGREHFCQRAEACDGEGWEWEDTTPALGHDWSDWELAIEPTCTEAGVECRWCNRDDCDGTWENGDGWDEREVPALGHSWNTTVTKAATCTEDGEETSVCATCGETVTTVIPATGHSAVAVADKPATCTETGLSGRTVCSVCNQVVNEGAVFPMLEHRVGVGAVIRAATCTTEGLMAFSCQDCGVQVSTETIPALGHAVAIDPAVAATCTTTGLTEGSHCTACNEVLTAQQTIPALGHDWDEGEVTKAATCSATGVRTHHCTRCDVAGEQEIAIDPNAHSWGAWTVVRNAAVGVEGSEQRVCAHDGTHVETRAIAALQQPQNGGNANGATTGGNAASGATGGNGAAGGATGGVEAAMTGGTGNVAGTQGAGEAIEGDETPLAAPDETTIADDANPLAAGNARVQQEGVDWAPVAVAVGAFVLVDGVAIAYVLRKRRRNRMM